MSFLKEYSNGLKLIVTPIEGLLSVNCGILVKTGSINENEQENGISHFIEHCMFKGTKTRNAFEISDGIDRIGAQINAFTSKELTCYYTKSTSEHFEESFGILSDIFCNSIFEEQEIEREKGVVLEEINMSEDTPEDICLDLLAKSYYGKTGLGQPILGSNYNVKRFTRQDILDYMSKYYTADNIVVSISGNVYIKKVQDVVEKYFVDNILTKKSANQIVGKREDVKNLYKYKKIEQTHIAFAMPGISLNDNNTDAFAIANTIFGGGMSSRLFQIIREKLGLAYSVCSYISQYKNSGILEIYAGVNTEKRLSASEHIIAELDNFRKNGITEKEFLRGKEQIKSSFIMGQENGSSQMILYGKYLLFLDKVFSFSDRIKNIENITFEDVNQIVHNYFNSKDMSTAIVGPIKKPLVI